MHVKDFLKTTGVNVFLFLASVALATLGMREATGYFSYVMAVPLYFLLRRLSVNESILYGWSYGAYFSFSTHIWLAKFEKFDPFISAVLILGSMFALVFLASSILIRRYKNSLLIELLGFAWMYYFALAISHFFLYVKAFLTLTHPQTFFDWTLPFFGSGMVNFLMVAGGFIIAKSAEHLYKNKPLTRLFPYLISLGVLFTIGMVKDVADLNTAEKNTVKVAVVQGNFNWSWEKRVELAQQILDYYIGTTKEVSGFGAKIVVWPEYAVATDIIRENPDLSNQIAKAAKDLDVVIVLGSLEHLGDKPIDRKWIGYDVSLVYDPEKGRLKPYRAVYPYSSNVKRGTEPMIFETKYGNFPVLSCFEIGHYKFVNDLFHRGKRVDFIIAIANNQVFYGSDGYIMLKTHAHRVAGETNRFLTYVTNTGPTVIFDNSGKEVARVPFDTQGYTFYDVEKIPKRSLYSIWQEWPFFIASAAIGVYLYKKRKESK